MQGFIRFFNGLALVTFVVGNMLCIFTILGVVPCLPKLCRGRKSASKTLQDSSLLSRFRKGWIAEILDLQVNSWILRWFTRITCSDAASLSAS